MASNVYGYRQEVSSFSLSPADFSLPPLVGDKAICEATLWGVASYFISYRYNYLSFNEQRQTDALPKYGNGWNLDQCRFCLSLIERGLAGLSLVRCQLALENESIHIVDDSQNENVVTRLEYVYSNRQSVIQHQHQSCTNTMTGSDVHLRITRTAHASINTHIWNLSLQNLRQSINPFPLVSRPQIQAPILYPRPFPLSPSTRLSSQNWSQNSNLFSPSSHLQIQAPVPYSRPPRSEITYFDHALRIMKTMINIWNTHPQLRTTVKDSGCLGVFGTLLLSKIFGGPQSNFPHPAKMFASIFLIRAVLCQLKFLKKR